jgi:hypothetical protein
LSLPADQRQGDDEHNGDKKSDPSFDFVGTSHLYIINVNIVYMMIAGSGTFPRCGNGGAFTGVLYGCRKPRNNCPYALSV